MTVAATPYEAFLDLHPLVLVLIVGVPAALLTYFATWLGKRLTAKGDPGGFGDFAAAIIGLLGGAFIFVGAFAVVTSWENQSQLSSHVTSEFQTMTALVEDVKRADTDPSLHMPIFADFETYATMVRDTELGTLGVDRANPEAEAIIVDLETRVMAIADDPAVPPLLAENLYAHIQAVHDARASRLSIHLPNLPAAMNILMALSAALMLLVIGLTPVGVLGRLKSIFAGSAVAITVLLIVSVLVLQSPSDGAAEISKPVGEFLSFIAKTQA
jgi:hypothetical protein